MAADTCVPRCRNRRRHPSRLSSASSILTASAADPRRWLRTAIGAAIVIVNFRGRAPFLDLVSRCERVALETDDELYLAAARWLANMNIETSRQLLEAANRQQDPYAYALATVRFAIDACDQAPDVVDIAVRDARRVADEYDSQYIRDYAAAANGHRAAIYGDIPTALGIGVELAMARTPAMRRHAYELLLAGGLAAGDEAALQTAVELAQHDLRRGVVDAELHLDWARSALALVHGDDTPRTRLWLEYHPLIACRDAVDRGVTDLDRDEVAGLAPQSVVRHAYRHILDGLIDSNEDAWHAALDVALRHDVRPVAVDTFEGLAAIAAVSDSSVEAMRLLGAADRLMEETGYQWRFPSERRRHDDAVTRGDQRPRRRSGRGRLGGRASARLA